jgi:hypothetical protein
MFRTAFPSIIRSSRLHIQQRAYVKQLLLPAASGNEMELFHLRPKHVECFTRINNLRNECTLLVLPYEYITMHRPMNVKNKNNNNNNNNNNKLHDSFKMLNLRRDL